jgi:signal transduction histidine kinase/putative methionine-R-sulfoxide reductase with GAF domain
MSNNNPKYKRLESLLSEAKPAEPNPAAPSAANGEVDALKAKVASLEAALETSRSKPMSIPATAEPLTQIPAPRREPLKRKPVDVQEPATLIAEPVSSDQQRKNMELVVRFLVGIGAFAVVFYFVVYLQTGVWQIVAESGFILAAIAVILGVAIPMLRRNKFKEASTWLLIGISIAYASPEIVWKNATTNLLVTGMLLLFVVGTIYPPQPATWWIVPSIYVVYMFAANLFEPLPRFDINQSQVLRVFIPGVTVFIGIGVIWQLYTLIVRYSQEELASTRNRKEKTAEGIRSSRFGQSPFWRALSRLLLEPDGTVVGVEPRRQAQLLTTSLAIIIPLYILGQFFRTTSNNSIETLIGASIALALIAAYGISRTRYFQTGSLLTVAALTGSTYSSFLKDTGQFTSSEVLNIVLWITLPLVISSIILSARLMAIYYAGNVIAMVAIAFMPAVPASPMFPATTTVIINSILLYVGRRFREQIEQESQAKLRAVNEDLETSERISQSLNQNLFLAAEVARRLSRLRDLGGMLSDAADLIRSNFDLYYVQVYLINPNQNSLVLESGTGSVGLELLRRKHRLNLDGSSINGRAATEKRAVIVEDTATTGFFRPNPLLPETRSEMAVPLLVGERVVGVLDLQSREAGALNDDVLPAFEALAGQLAIAIQNAQLFAETELARAEVEAQARRLTQTGWSEYLNAIHKPERTGYVFDQNQIIPLAEAESSISPAANTIASPIEVTGEPIGTFAVELDQEKWTAEAKELIASVTRQVANQVENLRLLETAERYRTEAENITRRLTHEGWEEYSATRGKDSLGYSYDLEKVIPLKENGNVNPAQAVAVPLSIRDEAIGELILHKNTSEEINEIIDAVSKQLSSHLENLRLSEQNEMRAAELEKLVTQLRELDRLKSSFLANMSHELRTPLNSILGFTDVMLEELDGPLTPNMDNDLRLIQKNGKHLLHLINDVLDMAKIESGKMNLVVEKFNLNETIEDVINITSPLANERSVAVLTDPESDRDIFIRADHTRLRQVLINLVNNGIKFTDKGSVSVRVKHMGNDVQIAVKDTGLGIPTDHLDAVFQEFHQVDSSTTRKAGGTGLGLPISRRLIEMHGGRLWAESSGVEGEGSTFFISMPVEAVVAEAAVSEPLTKK